MSADPNKKSARTFQCRDVLWETFEQMARELECSVDYLINEAMKQYARQRSYGTRTPFPGRQDAVSSPPPQPQMPQQHGGGGGYPVPPPPARNAPPLGPPPSQRMPPPPMRNSGLAAPPPPPHQARQFNPAPPNRGMGLPPMTQPRSVPPPAPRSVPPPIPPRGPTPLPPPAMGGMGGGQNGFPQPMAHASQLNVIYQGEKVPVTKDRFVIGRGKQSSDLTLKDPNVSRQHAMVEFQNGVYFMVDMGSTNGVEYNGQRIARKQISEGDVFKICDHEMRFTYR